MQDTATRFFESLADEIVDRLEKLQSQRQRLYDLDRAAEYLGLTPDALRQKALAGVIKRVSLDSRLRFDVRDLDAAIEFHKN